MFIKRLVSCTVSKIRHPCCTASIHDTSSDVANMRAAYRGREELFTDTDLAFKEPISQFKVWFEQACNTSGIVEPNAMCLATASSEGIPSARYVLLKGFGADGFKFFTNYESRKGKELKENPHAALTFYWEPLRRSVRIEGKVERLSAKESDEYFHSRPSSSQIGACVSNQSTVISGRAELNVQEQQLSQKYKGQVIPRPSYWGGFIVVPRSVEFWQGQSDRLHDRIRFRRCIDGEKVDGRLMHQGEDGWVYERLAP